MSADLLAAYGLLAQYGFLVDFGKYEGWRDLFSPRCSYYARPRENHELGLEAALIYCDSRTMLEDRIQALRIVSKYNIHNDRHIIGLPRIVSNWPDGVSFEARRLPCTRRRKKATLGCSPPDSIATGSNGRARISKSARKWCSLTASRSRACSLRHCELRAAASTHPLNSVPGSFGPAGPHGDPDVTESLHLYYHSSGFSRGLCGGCAAQTGLG